MNFLGPSDDPELSEAFTPLVEFSDRLAQDHRAMMIYNDLTTYSSQWERAHQYGLELISPFRRTIERDSASQGGVPSVLVSRDTASSGVLAHVIKSRLRDCVDRSDKDVFRNCQSQQLFADITGNVGSPQEPNVSIPPSFRTALAHFVFGQWCVHCSVPM